MGRIKNIIKGICISIIITLVSFLIFAIVLAYTNVSEQTIEPVRTVIIWISVIIGITEIFKGNKNKKIHKNS